MSSLYGVGILTTFKQVVVSTLVFISTWLIVHFYVCHYKPISPARLLIKINSWVYSFISLLMLISIMFGTDESAWPAYFYHLSKFYEYVDIILVRASGVSIALHFGIHHLTTPYFTFIRVLNHNAGWKVFAILNTFHHVLMYAYFGGAGVFRPILPWTGGIQLVVGIAKEVELIWGKKSNGILPNIIAAGILSMYLVLFTRDLRVRTEQKLEKYD